MNLEEMYARRDALLAARFRGVRTVEIEGRRITYATDAEMASAIADLERRIAETNSPLTKPAFDHGLSVTMAMTSIAVVPSMSAMMTVVNPKSV
jgi:hypothetical protein